MSARFALSLTGRGSRGVYSTIRGSARGLSMVLQQASPYISKMTESVGIQPINKPACAPEKIGGRASWTAADLLKNPAWGIQLTEDELAELDSALQYSKTAPTPIEWEEDGVSRIPLNVSPANFPLDKMAKRVEALAEEHVAGASNRPYRKADSHRASKVLESLATGSSTAR